MHSRISTREFFIKTIYSLRRFILTWLILLHAFCEFNPFIYSILFPFRFTIKYFHSIVYNWLIFKVKDAILILRTMSYVYTTKSFRISTANTVLMGWRDSFLLSITSLCASFFFSVRMCNKLLSFFPPLSIDVWWNVKKKFFQTFVTVNFSHSIFRVNHIKAEDEIHQFQIVFAAYQIRSKNA